ncbi:MAG: sodium-dependent transporter [Simkaniaceae bacterium]|nr:sodium-dependent transporter [Simkaniaceae bacterium]
MTTREHWSSRLGFIFAAVGSAVGLGVLWKFPYTVGQNGGGLFLLSYIICILVIGIPVFIGELAIGRVSQRAAVGAFAHLCMGKTSWKVGGWLGVISSFFIMGFYPVVAGWGMSYVLMSLTGFYQNLTEAQIGETYHLLSHSGSITLFWQFLFTLITMGIVLSGVRKGIEFWSRIMTRALFILLLILFFYACRLSGFKEAAYFIFAPDWGEFHLSSVLEALGLAFFTLSLGQGIMISYGSYLKEDVNLPNMASIVGGSVIVVAMLAAMTVFPIVFTFGLSPSAGTGMIFTTLPFLFAKLPGALILSTIFFVLFVFTALTSAIPFVEVVATNLMELLGWERKKAVLTTCLATFTFGIPAALSNSASVFPEWSQIYGKTFFATIEQLVFIWFVPVAGLITSLFIGWVVDKEILKANIPGRFFPLWHFFMRWVIPAIIFLIIIDKGGILAF